MLTSIRKPNTNGLSFLQFFVFLFLSFSPLMAQVPRLEWATSFQNSDINTGYAIAVDGSGNVYTLGTFSETVDFDPGAGVYSLTSTNGSNDIYILKQNAAGDFVWAIPFGGDGFEEALGLAVDASGNVYIGGLFTSSLVDFDPGPGDQSLSNAGGNDGFVLKLDTDGNLVWVQQLAGTDDEWVYSLAIDSDGNVITTGNFSGTTDFDGGPGTFELTAASTGVGDIFISKLDASGAFVWANAIGTSNYESSYDVAIDSLKNIIITTEVPAGTIDVDPGAGVVDMVPTGISNNLILKLDEFGNFVWAKVLNGDLTLIGSTIATDQLGNIIVGGNFVGTTDFDPDAGIFNVNSNGDEDAFLLKLKPDGSFSWVRTFGSINSEYSNSITTDASNNVIATGQFGGDVDFDPGAGTAILTPVGTNNVFLLKLDENGDYVWAGQIGSTVGGQFASSIITDINDNVYSTGYFQGTHDFDPSPCVYTMTKLDNVTTYILKVGTTAATCFAISQQPQSVTTCAGQTATFMVEAVGAANIQYQWQFFDAGIPGYVDLTDNANLSGANSQTLTITNASAANEKTYRCKVSGDGFPDIFSNDVTLAISEPPGVTNDTRCGAGVVTLVANGGTDGQYRWYPSATGSEITGEVNSSFTTPVLTATTSFFVSIHNGTCESARIEVVATVNTPPAKPTLSGSITPVGNAITVCSSNTLTLSAPNGFASYVWSNGETTSTITVTTDGSYSVIVTDGAGCSSVASDAIAVTIVPAPCNNVAPVIASSSLTTTSGASASLNLLSLISDPDNNLVASSLAIVQGPSSGAAASINSGVLTIDYAGLNFAGTDLITIEVCDMFGECTQQQFAIEVIGEMKIYNAVSPNNDGKNDFFKIEYIEI
ncbi:MAG TPA: hypothetical protein PKM03_09690, partial [Cyclobacteriaceae bacterium]|nr:hypothetical protein [Cyclobacteriaceae bacterium]